MKFRQPLYFVLILALESLCWLTSGCSCNAEKSTQLAVSSPPSSPTIPMQEERTNERLKGLSQRDQDILQAENNFIKYFTVNCVQQKAMRKQILTDAQFIKSLGNQCPGHLPYLATYLQYQYKAISPPSYNDPWQQAAYDYIISRTNLAEELTACQQYRTGTDHKFSAINHIEVGMLSRERADFLCNLVAKAEPLVQLNGKTVVDIGGGVGLLLAKLTPYVKLSGSGKLICIDIEPKLAEFSNFIGKYDPTFKNIDYRLTNSNGKDIPLQNKEADLICIFDVHNIYDQFSPTNEIIRRQSGQQYLLNLKSKLKAHGSILIYDSAELMAPAEIVEDIAKNADFAVHNLPIKEANGHYLLQLTKP